MKTRARTRIGDIIEFETPVGLAYAQYTHNIDPYGNMIRVFSKTYKERPEIEEIAKLPVQFSTFFPINSAAKQGCVKILGEGKIDLENRNPPLFRQGIAHLQTGKVETWFLWKGGDAYETLGALPRSMRRLPILEVCNIDCLVDRVTNGWTPENDPESL